MYPVPIKGGAGEPDINEDDRGFLRHSPMAGGKLHWRNDCILGSSKRSKLVFDKMGTRTHLRIVLDSSCGHVTPHNATANLVRPWVVIQNPEQIERVEVGGDWGYEDTSKS